VAIGCFLGRIDYWLDADGHITVKILPDNLDMGEGN
jgi:hypothetical protein